MHPNRLKRGIGDNAGLPFASGGRGMIWRTSDGAWLVQGRSHRIQLGLSRNRVRLPDGSLIRESSEYVRIGPDGALLQRYPGPRTSTVDDDLYVFDIHVVLGDALHRCTWIENFRDGDELRDSVCFSGLEPVTRDRLPEVVAQTMAQLVPG